MRERDALSFLKYFLNFFFKKWWEAVIEIRGYTLHLKPQKRIQDKISSVSIQSVSAQVYKTSQVRFPLSKTNACVSKEK